MERSRGMILTVWVAALAILAGLWPLQRDIYTHFPGGHPADTSEALRLGGIEGMIAATGFRRVAANLLWMRTDSLFHSNLTWKIAPLYESIVRLDPHFILVWDTYGWHCAYNLDAAAKKEAKEARKAGKPEEEAYANSLSDLWVARGIEVYIRAIKANPDDWDLPYKLGWLYFDRLQLFEDGEKWFKVSLQHKDAPFTVDHMLAHVYEYDWKVDQALAAWRGALKKNPTDAVSLTAIEFWEGKRVTKPALVATWQAALEKNPGDEKARAEVAYWQGQVRQLEREFEAAKATLRTDPTNKDARKIYYDWIGHRDDMAHKRDIQARVKVRAERYQMRPYRESPYKGDRGDHEDH
jgi:hypothetical protein